MKKLTSCPSWIRLLFQKEDPQNISLFDHCSLLFLFVTCVWYTTAYMVYGVTPAENPNGSPGWWAWYDQSQYYKSTIALAHGELKPSVYWIGYPLLGAPFYWLLPRHPYFIPNLVMVMIMVGSFFATCRHFMSRLEALMLVFFFIFMEEILRDSCLIVPWNTMPSYAAIYLLAYLLLFKRPTLGHFALGAFACGLALLSRPNEIIPLAPLYLFALLNLEGRRRWIGLLFFGLALGFVGLVVASLNFHFYGHLASPYMNSESGKFGVSNFGVKIYQLFCDGTFLTGNAVFKTDTHPHQILEQFPFFILLLPGAIYLVRTHGPAVWGLLLAIIFSVGFYLMYNLVDNPPYFWTYGSFHYLWWIIPWLGFMSYLSLRQAPFLLSRRSYLLALLIPPIICLLVGFRAVEEASSDAKENPLTFTTGYSGQVYTVNLVSGSDVGTIEDIRLFFQTPPTYNGTAADTGGKIKLTINGAVRPSVVEYCISQEGNNYDFSFLAHGLKLKKDDHITISLSQTSEPVLTRISLRQVRFAPGRIAARLLME